MAQAPVDLAADADPNLPEELRAHLAGSALTASANLERIASARKADIDTLVTQFNALQKVQTPPAQRLMRVRYLAGQWSAIFAAGTACASGCNHCCHINATVPRSEALLIAKATGAVLAKPAQTFDIGTDKNSDSYKGVACTFLVAGQCSIYKDRPLVCRTLVNMDSVDLLCRLLPDMQVPVPYLNTLLIQGLFGSLTYKEPFADVRDWFPDGLKEKTP